jgi:dienelactone hydrolase
MRRAALVVTSLAAGLLVAAPAQGFDPAVEAQNFGKGNERSAIYNTPEYQAKLRTVGTQNRVNSIALQAGDPERNFTGHLCASGEDGCAGDVRLYDWQAKGYGVVQPFLFTARNGATISGHVWATKAGPARRPAIVITNGSVQAPEQVYWFAAQALAKDGYVVLTFDPQGQGQSDELGESPDQNEGSPAQADGRPFFDGTDDAIDFMLSTPAHPYVPEKSCESGTSHAAKQNRRVKEGRDAAFNPFWKLVDASRLGIAGHSFGASGVSYVGQRDPRVKAIVAWDNLGSTDPSGSGRTSVKGCPARPEERTVPPITKPSLGMSADYFIPPTPNTSDPDPLGKSVWSRKYSQAGVDTGELIIRGGTHYDFDWVPNQAFPATLRGADMIAWYTTAWFDKYVKGGDPSADKRLLTTRWRNDAQEGAVDPHGDANMFSFYYRSRLDIGLAGGGHFTCEDIRPGCPGLLADDGQPGGYDFLKIDTSADHPGTSGTPAGTGINGCGRKPGREVHLQRKRVRIVRAAIYIDGKRVKVVKRHRIRTFTIPSPGPGKHRVKTVLTTSRGKKLVSVRTYKGCRKSKPRRVK